MTTPDSPQKSLRERLSATDVGDARLIVMPDPTLPIVHFTLAFRHGALLEADAEVGALSMLMQLLLRGTKERSRSAFHEALEELGSSLDVSVGHEMALVRGASLARHFAETVQLLCEALQQPALASDALRDLVEETCDQLRSERDDDDAVADLFLRRAFYDSTPLARAAIGTARQLQALSAKQVAGAQRALTGKGLIAAFAGAVTEAEAEAAMAPLLVFLAARPTPSPPPPVERPNLAATRIWLVDKPARTQAQLRVAVPGVHCKNADIDLFWLGTVAFGGTFTSPLTREVRDKRGWSYTAHADFRRRSVFASPVVLRSAPALPDAVACLALEFELLDALAQGKMEQSDLERARDYLLGRAPFWTASAFDVVSPALSLSLLEMPLDRLWDAAEQLRAIHLPSIPEAMARHLHGKAPVAVVVGSKDALLPGLRDEFGADAVRTASFDDDI